MIKYIPDIFREFLQANKLKVSAFSPVICIICIKTGHLHIVMHLSYRFNMFEQ